MCVYVCICVCGCAGQVESWKAEKSSELFIFRYYTLFVNKINVSIGLEKK